MFYITNLPNQNIDLLKSNMTSRVGQSGDAVSPFYQMDFPFQLEFYTIHPDDGARYFTMTSLSPDRMIYCTRTQEEMHKYFESPGLHHHNYFELMFVLEGNLYQNIENQRHLYPTGSCCLLNKNILHSEEHSTDYRIAFLDLSDTVIRDIYNDLSLSFFEIEKNRQLSQLETFLSENLIPSSAVRKNYIDFIPVHDNTWSITNVHNIFEQITLELAAPQIGSSHSIKGLIAKLH